MNKHKYLIATILTLILIQSFSKMGYSQGISDRKFDFRNTQWGMSKVEVKATEFTEPVEDKDDMLVYADVIGGGMNVLVAYIFEDGKLAKGKYLIHPTEKNDYISDYKTVKEILTLKYDSPRSDEQIWKEEIYKEDPSKWALAVSSGNLVYKTVWETETSLISLVLHGQGGNTMFGVVYSNRKPRSFRGSEEEKS